MRKLVLGLLVSVLLLAGLASARISEKSINRGYRATVAIASYFVNEAKDGFDVYLGSGILLGTRDENYVLSTKHLFMDEKGQQVDHVLGIMPGFQAPVEMEVVYVSEYVKVFDDYALLRFMSRIDRQGVRVRDHDFVVGEEVFFLGTTGGLLFNLRIGFATSMQYRFTPDENGKLVDKPFEGFPYLQVWPGGEGDSGGGVYDRDGKLIGMIYCKTGGYMNANPLRFLRAFLKSVNLEKLE